ncbi:polyphenol oxidase family protein [Candidatus Parcubacteria bacterium]|nr:polyphenol oxidase family protein [Candidatus Parcubacteria bacterium]
MKNCVLSQDGKAITFSDENIFFGLTTTQFGDFSSKNGNTEKNQKKIKNLAKEAWASSCLHIIPRHDSAMSLINEANDEFLSFERDALLYQDKKMPENHIGIIHCSHITLADMIIEWTMPYVKLALDKKIENLKALIYSGICQDCYEVGLDVFGAFSQNHGYQKFFKKNGKPKKYQFNLAGLIGYKLMESGIAADNIKLLNICSHHNTFGNFTNNGDDRNILFSHRRQEMERNLIFCKLQEHDVLLTATTGNCPYTILYA